jgi:hypothetical protein
VLLVHTVEHCLASRSYLTCQNEFMGTFSYSSMSTVITFDYPFPVTGEILQNFRSNMKKSVNARIAGCGGHFRYLM